MSPHFTKIAFIAAIALSAVGCNRTTDPAPYEWAGIYSTATKFGGASGTWTPSVPLVIGEDRVVTYGSATIINPSISGTSVAWSRADGNTHNADFTLMTSSSDSYYWDAPVSGRLFQGRRQSAGEGYLDFRGRVD